LLLSRYFAVERERERKIVEIWASILKVKCNMSNLSVIKVIGNNHKMIVYSLIVRYRLDHVKDYKHVAYETYKYKRQVIIH